tara:strand:- start:1084 stop:2280 length:1197 start_codon:yes stop_codon:yes gene_type:complete
MNRKYKIVIFGATGFTGELCAKFMSEKYSDIPIAIAGRSLEKLEKIKNKHGLPFPIIVADAFDVNALEKMCKDTEVVLSTAGPYHKYGSDLLGACVKNGCHYVDITGESFWIKDMIEKHHKEASNKGVRVINACGFDSAPSDLGVFYAVNQVAGSVKSVQCFQAWKGEASGGTMETMFSSMDAKLAKGGLGKFSLNPKNSISENQKKKTSDKITVQKIPHLGGWTGPFVMALPNTRVVRRSAALSKFTGKYYGDDFVYSEGAYYSKKGAARKVTFMTLALGLIIVSPLRKLLRGFFRKPGEGPSQEAMDSGFFKSRFLIETKDGFRAFSMSSSGDPGYKMTSRMACESALCLAIENPASLPGGEGFGGLLTPSVGLGNVLINRLKNIGVSFEEISLNN